MKKVARRKTEAAVVAKDAATIISREAIEAKEKADIRLTESQQAKENLRSIEEIFNDDVTN